MYVSLCADTICRSQLEGVRHPRTFTELIERPELRFHGVQSLFVQLLQRATGPRQLTAYLARFRISMLLASFSQTISHSPFHSGHPTRHSRIVIRQCRANLLGVHIFLTVSHQMERVDYTTNPLLRSPSQLANHIYRMGHSWSSCSGASGWHDFQVVQQKMVRSG
jgi:hypothetical protein